MNTLRTALIVSFLLGITSNHAFATEWWSGFAMGTSEYTVTDDKGNELYIACPSEDGEYVRATATIAGTRYSSQQGDGFNVIVDGYTNTNPFDTYCRLCGEDFPNFWDSLRNARTLQVSAGGQTVKLPTTNIGVLPALGDPANTCQSAW